MEQATGEDKRGDLLICGFWARGADCAPGARVTDAHAKSHCKRTPAKVPELQEKEKKRKHLEVGLKRRCHFTPPVCSVDGALERGEAKTFTRSPAAKLASKWEVRCSQVRGCVQGD